MRGRLNQLAASLSAFLLLGSLAAQQHRIPAELWSETDRTLLGTTVVVRGRLQAPDPLALVRAADHGGGYVELRLEVEKVLTPLEEDELPPTRVTFFAASARHPHSFHPTAQDMRNQLGEEALFLLQGIGDRHFLADRFRNTSILPTAYDSALRQLLEEHRSHRGTPLPDAVPYGQEVDALLSELAADSNEEARAAWRSLTQLPIAAIPALARRITSEHPLPDREMLLRQVDGQELQLQAHRPPTVGHAALLLLQHITGERIGPAEVDKARPSQLERAACCWRVLAHRVLLGVGRDEKRTQQSR